MTARPRTAAPSFRRSLPPTLNRLEAEAIAAAFLGRRRVMHGDATMTAPGGEGGQQQGQQGGQSDAGQGGQQAADQGGQSTGGGQTGGQAEGAKFTQADLDRIIGERVAAEQAKAQKAIKDAQELAGKNETEKLTIERDQAKQQATEAQTKAAQRIAQTEAKVAAIAAGANPERVAAIVRNADLAAAVKDGDVDESAIKAAVEKVLTEYPEWKAKPNVAGQSGGEMNGGGDTGKPTFTRDQLAKMTPDEVAERAEEINSALADGRVTG